MNLDDKVAVVTGGASGIGRATCQLMALEGIKAVGVVDMTADIDSVCAEMNGEAGRDVMIPFRGDVVDRTFRDEVFADLERRFERVSLCVPAAGITRDRLAVKLDKTNGTVKPDIYDESDFRRVIEVDLLAPIYWAMRTIASVAMDRSRKSLKKWFHEELVQGVIVLIGSVSSAGNRGQISYATAKAGLEGAQATLAKEAIFYGVRCAIIHPGFTDTPMVRALGEDIINEQVLPNTQLGRLIRPDEIANAILFLLKNSSISGQLWADAGWHAPA